MIDNKLIIKTNVNKNYMSIAVSVLTINIPSRNSGGGRSTDNISALGNCI